MPSTIIARSLLLPELELTGLEHFRSTNYLQVKKKTPFEFCPKCARRCESVYDHRTVQIKDEPIRGKGVYLVIKKRRFFCGTCSKPFTEYVDGIKKGYRTTQRLKSSVLWACENFTDLKRVRRAYRCSSWYVYKAFYEQLELKRRRRQYPCPNTIGIDEHSFRRNKKGYTDFASLIADYRNKRVMDVAQGKTVAELNYALSHIAEPENVENVVVDLCDPFKSFAYSFFPNCKVIADKFHVLRLLHGPINKRRNAIVGDRRINPIGRLLLKNGSKLDYFVRKTIALWLEPYPELKEIYQYKEALHRFYRIRGYRKARCALINMTDQMAYSKTREIQTLRRTLMKWKEEILAYFLTGLTNGRTESYNNLAKLVQRRAFGYKSFENYRLRLLNACA